MVDSSRVVTFFLRIFLAAVMLIAGVLKGLNPEVFQKDILSYGIVGWEVSFLLAYYLPYFEICLGVALLIRKGYKTALYLTGALLSVFTLLLLYTIAAGIDIGCGCFGDSDPFNSAPLAALRDLILIAVVVFLLFRLQLEHSKKVS